MNWKKILSYIPGVGLIAHGISEYKIRKEKSFPYYNLEKPEDKKAIKTFGIQTAYLTVPWIIKLGLLKLALVYYNGNSNVEQNIYQDKKIDSLEINKKLKKDSKLEKLLIMKMF